jgi:predicted Zn-dependent protease
MNGQRLGVWSAAAVALGLGLAACNQQGQKNLMGSLGDIGNDLKAAVTPVDEKDEIAIGREVAGRTLGAAHLVPDRALQNYVNRVGRWVALQSERPDLPWHFGVIDTASVNAFAAPGGYVLITRGLYEMLDNEAQLAAVLGHEITHVVERHHISVMQKSALLSAGTRVAQSQTSAKGSQSSALVTSLVGNGAEIFARGLDKGAEFEADQHGVILAARAGYNPYALVDVLQKLQARGGKDSNMALLFATHPAPSERLHQLGDALTPKVASLPSGSQPRIRRIAPGTR